MATRSAKLYQGEDMLPVLNYTEFVIWEESEFGTRAWQGEGSASTVVIRDPLGEQGNELLLPAGLTAKSLASKNLLVIDLDGEYMFRGRVGIKNYSRDDQHVERYRQVECSLHDTNWDLDHIFVNDYPRPAETDTARIQGIIASHLAGSPRATTNLNGSNFLSGSNTVNLAEQTYNRTSPLSMIREISRTANKQFFVTGDSIGGGSLFWDGNDSTVYQAGIRISDREDEVDTSGDCSTPQSPELVSVAEQGGNQHPGSLEIQVSASDDNRALYCVLILNSSTAADINANAVRWRPINLGDAGDQQSFTLIGETGASTPRMQLWRLLSPNASQSANSCVRLEMPNVGVWSAGTWYLRGVDQATPNGTVATNTGTGTTSSLSITADAGDFVINGAGAHVSGTIADPVIVAGQTEDFARNDTTVFTANALGGGHGDTTPGWTFDASEAWHAIGVGVNLAGASAITPTFPPIWNVGPSSTEDGSDQLCEVVLFYGTNADQYVTAHNLTVHNQYGHASATFTDDAEISAATALLRAKAILAHRQYEDKTYNVTIGPLTDDQVLCVKHGQTIPIKARAIPDADDQFRTMRIVQCRYTTPVVGTWFAHMQLGRPWKLEPYGSGPTLVPTTAGELTIADAGGHFTEPATVESALQELGAGSAGGISTVVDHPSMGAAETFDFTASSDHEGTQDANLTVTLTGATDGEAAWLTLKLTQDATGGRTLTLPASVVTKATVEADWDTTALAVNVLTLFSYDGGVTWYAFLAGATSGGSDTAWIVDPGAPSYAGTGPVTVTLTSVFGIDSSGNPYYNAANVTDGEEAALVWDSDTETYLLRPYYP